MNLQDLIAKYGNGSTPESRNSRGSQSRRWNDFKQDVHALALDELQEAFVTKEPSVDRRKIVGTLEDIVDELTSRDRTSFTRKERQQMIDEVADEVLGLGPLEPLIRRDDITEIMVNGPDDVYVEKDGKIKRTGVQFRDEDQLMTVIRRIVEPLGRRIDANQPYVDARLRDGSRVNVIIPPLIMQGPTLTIRKFRKEPYRMTDLIDMGTLSRTMARFLEACVKAELNILISGGTGSGKTTTLNCLSGFIPEDDRIITIENAIELQLQQPHVLQCETRDANVEGRGRITMQELLINSLRMRPDRIIVGECRGGEAMDMLQAMNTGHDGSMTTVHANTPRDALARLSTLCLMAGMELPERAIRGQIASAIDIVIQQTRMADGSRRITDIIELQGLEGDQFILSELFEFERKGIEDEKIVGSHRATGVVPLCASEFKPLGIDIPEDLFRNDTPAVK